MLLNTIVTMYLLSSVVTAAPTSTTQEEEEDPLETSETGHFRRKRVWRKLLKQLYGLGGGGYGLGGGGYGLGGGGYGLGGGGYGLGLGGYALDYLLQGLAPGPAGVPGASHHHHGGHGYQSHPGHHGISPLASQLNGHPPIGYGGVHPVGFPVPLSPGHGGSPWGSYWGVLDHYGWGGEPDVFLDGFAF